MDQGAGLHTRPLIQPPGQGDGFKTYPLAREKDLNHPPAPGDWFEKPSPCPRGLVSNPAPWSRGCLVPCTPLVPSLLVSSILVLLSPGSTPL